MNLVTTDVDPTSIDFTQGATILIDKDKEWTSFDVVNKIRWTLRNYHNVKKLKVGHNGTLDPLATGLLMIFTGKATKLIPKEENHDKRYTGTIKFGTTTDSLDTETPEIEHCSYEHFDWEDINAKSNEMLGISMQKIPIYSATKIKGKRMYKLARKGEEVEDKFKEVNLMEINLLNYDPPYLKFELLCSKGTYVRAFARDFGLKLGTTAYLYDLRRTEIANYSVENAFEIHDFCNQIGSKEYKQ